MIMLHTRAVRFVHAFCCDVVVLIVGSSVSCIFCLALVPVSCLCFAYCFRFLVVIFPFCASVFVWLLFAFVLPLHLLAVLGLRLPEVTCVLWIHVEHIHGLMLCCFFASGFLIEVSVIGCAFCLLLCGFGVRGLFASCLFRFFFSPFFSFSLSLSLSLSVSLSVSLSASACSK